MRVAKAVTSLIEAFERLPGIGPKTAARLAYYLLHVPQTELDRFAAAISDLKRNTVECEICHNISESSPCDLCGDPSRDKSLICVVEQPLDVLAIERGNGYKGVYHVLHGVIDPLHNIGPDEIKIGELVERVSHPERSEGSRVDSSATPQNDKIREIILALNPNMEGEATCLYLKRLIKNTKITRLAHGLPIGGDIEYADDRTLTHALEGRREY